MGKVVATYNVKVTLREPDGLPETTSAQEPPTISRVEQFVSDAFLDMVGDDLHVSTVTAERTDI